MKLSASLIVAFTMYSLLGVCPMQINMMMPMSHGDMAMMSHEVTHEASGPMIGKAKHCGSCLTALNQFALKEVQVIGYTSPELITYIPFGYSQLITSTNDNDPNITAIARDGPIPLAPSIVKTIVLRT